MQKLRNSLRNIGAEGVSALDLIGRTADTSDIAKAEAIIQANYGVEYPIEKLQLLWEMILEEGWTAERLNRTVKWFIKNKRYPNWVIADWFSYGVKLYPYSKYLDLLNEKGKGINDEIEWFKIEGQSLFGFKAELGEISNLLSASYKGG